jgi:hypothetical protein
MITFGTDESERSLAAFWDAYVDAGRPGAAYAARRPRETLAALRAVRGLPRLDAAPSDSPGGRAVRGVLDARVSYGVPARLLGTAVLQVPPDPDAYTAGRRAQTLRRRIRAAERQGLKVRRVEDPTERHDLLAAADRAEQTHADPSYRVPDPDNDDLLQHDVWLTVDGSDGEPLLLTVAPRDGEFATLRYFRTLGSSDAHSDARYLASAALVTELSGLGVLYLLDTATPPEQTNGLRAFQRMVGFRYARIRLRR